MNKIVRQDIYPTFYEDTNLLARRDPDPIFFFVFEYRYLLSRNES